MQNKKGVLGAYIFAIKDRMRSVNKKEKRSLKISKSVF